MGQTRPRPRGLERPGLALAIVVAASLGLVIGVPYAVDAAIPDTRVVTLPESASAVLPGDGMSARFSPPGGWTFRRSDFAADRHLFSSPDGAASIEVDLVPVASSAAELLVREGGGSGAGDTVTGDVMAGGTFAWRAVAPDGGDGPTAIGVALLDGASSAFVVRGRGEPPGGDWGLLTPLLESVEGER